ncbi:MerR family transcriptional regulator [Furfurilactobacillus rossiae]|uniref:MerR family transcriptional regulator n=1 Tax=Furfurilactobacillus rossiae DSM 15814 TaxID=1114972 RepID=A0A0R1RD43_9LACO|nr:MerR family transcriptional regulator [Furfurilactobacillus rossiae]KRL53124.1 MerR family transcriptional regulator [Furfurilactobacillus rossiae DSM 15814]QFR67311.1 MerR family transcriptional regulator [Furfurilactobacillus rossiae]QLE60246.1 Transcriptional regulator MerR [Furfurilactobacillus rossiae]
MYSIGDIANIMGINTSAIRFYDRNGLLPFVQRDKAGRRKFKPEDLNFIEVIDCLKKSGVPVKDIAQFITLCMQGDQTLQERYDYLDDEEEKLSLKIEKMQTQLEFLQYKKWYYKTAIKEGTEDIHFLPNSRMIDPQTRNEFEEKRKVTADIHELTDL